MMDLLPVLGAFVVVAGVLAFLVWCGGQFDAEARKVEKAG